MEKFLKTPDFAIKCGKRTEHEIRMLRLIDYSTEFQEEKPYLLIYQSRNHLGRVEVRCYCGVVAIKFSGC
jgi:hypothetical protein